MTSARAFAVALVALAAAASPAGAHDAEVFPAQALPREAVAFETPMLTRPAATVISDQVTATGTVVVNAPREVRRVLVEIRHPRTRAVIGSELAPFECIENCKETGGSRTYRFGPVVMSPRQGGSNTLTATTTMADRRSMTGETTITRKSGTADLSLKALEINQGQRIVFDANPSRTDGRGLHTATSLAPAIGGRPTVVRAYAGAAGAPVANVTGLLFGFKDGQPLPESPLRPASPVTAIPDESTDVQAADAGRTLNFVLPPSWVAEDDASLRLTMELNSGALKDEEIIPECATCRNSADRIDIRTPQFLPGPAELRLIPHRTFDTPADLTEERMFESIARLFPIDPADIVIQDIDAATFIHNRGCNAVTTLMQRHHGSGRGMHYAVTLPSSPASCAGVAFFGAPYGAGLAGGMFDSFGDAVVAQEIGHELRLDHAGCSHGEQSILGCEVFPHPHGGIGNPGFDVENMLAIPPGNPVFTSPTEPHMHDFMSYGAPAQPALPDVWTSQRTWTELYTAMRDPQLNPGALNANPHPPPPPPPAPPPPPDQPPPEFPPLGPGKLLVIGQMGPEPSGAIAYVLDSAGVDFEVPPDPHEQTGEYQMRALDSGGNIVDQRLFSLTVDTSHVDSRIWFAVLEQPAGIAQIELLHNGSVISSRAATPDPPLVQWTDPPPAKVQGAGGAPPSSGKRKVSWTASDANGDQLTYNVEFSRDGGLSYEPVQMGLTDLSSTVDLSALPSTPNGRFRVTASDGFHETHDVANRTIAIGNHAPRPFITAPSAGSISPAGASVVLTGAATDVDEGMVPGRGLAWTSSRDGDLGTGVNLAASRLSIGRHRITLTGTDPDGEAARRSTTIRVVAGPDDGRAPRLTRVARRGRTVTVRFSEDVVGVGTSSLRLSAARGRALAATVSYNARTRTATLRARRGTPVEVTASGGSISDLGGRRLRTTSRGVR